MINIIPIPNIIKELSAATYKYSAADLICKTEENHGEEGYRLLIDARGVTAFASTPHGHFNAKMTLKQLCQGGALPNVHIIDAPRYPYRGYMLDTARHFFSVKTIKKQLDALALVKINVFHWHLTDDQGWRLDSARYPLLTSIGSKRKGTAGDNVAVEGYYTAEDIAEVIAYAGERFIQVIPEIDAPGHMSAAIAAYKNLACGGNATEVQQYFGIHEQVVCPAREGTYEFFYDLFNEISQLFPSKYIHLGGDEALRLHWLNCPDCQSLIKKQRLKDCDELQGYFMSRLTAFLRMSGKRVINWNDGMLGSNVPSDVVVQYWKESKRAKSAAINRINNGCSAIMSPFFSYYLDYPYEMTALKKTYNFNPELSGIVRTDGILGVEAPLWTEYVRTESELEYKTYPRVLAVAESGWTHQNNKNYLSFTKRLKYLLSIFDKMGIKCATIGESNPSIFKAYKVASFFINSSKGSRGSIQRTRRNNKAIKTMERTKNK